MSKAFTRESDDDGVTELPDREISSFPNLVTADGLAQIEAEIARHSDANVSALSAGDKEAAARASRELRYWTARRNTAQVQPAPDDLDLVTFGSV
ncbi:MAG: transcription elongation factor, partial [Hyphomonadaceae bacterium]|nr:transcription elongation factor [Hyphomonadaceae bacterium]